MAADAPPILFEWKGDGFAPATPYQARLADKHFVIGEKYPLVEHQERSHRSHAHYFARIHEAWLNLPEDRAEQFQTEEHLRKWALIKAGFHNSDTLVCSSNAEALRTAAFLRPTDTMSVVLVKGSTVTRYTALSQSTRAMGKTDFQRSKDAVLQIISDVVEVSKKDLEGSNPA